MPGVGHGSVALVGALRDPPGQARGGVEVLRAGPRPRQVLELEQRAAVPGFEGLGGGAEGAATDRALEPVGVPGGGHPRSADEGEHVLGAHRARGGAKQRQEPPPDRGAGERDVGLHRHGDREIGQDRLVEARVAIGRAEHDGDVVRLDPGRDQTRDLAPDLLGLAALAGGLHQHESVVRLEPVGAIAKEGALEVMEDLALGVRGVGLERAPGKPAALGQLLVEPRPGGKRGAVLVGNRDRDLRRVRQRRDQLELLDREVVEPVDEHRATRPRRGVCLERGHCAIGDQVIVAVSEGVASRGVLPVQGRELAEIWRIGAGGRGVGRERGGIEERCLCLADQRRQGGGEAGPDRRPGERSRSGPLNRAPHHMKALVLGQRGRHDPASRLGDVLEQAPEGPNRDAEHRAPVARRAELALDAIGVVEPRHDEYGIALELRFQERQDLPCLTRVRRSDDQRKSHAL